MVRKYVSCWAVECSCTADTELLTWLKFGTQVELHYKQVCLKYWKKKRRKFLSEWWQNILKSPKQGLTYLLNCQCSLISKCPPPPLCRLTTCPLLPQHMLLFISYCYYILQVLLSNIIDEYLTLIVNSLILQLSLLNITYINY